MDIKIGKADFEPVATMMGKYGHMDRYTYTGRVFIIDKNGHDNMPGVDDKPLKGTYYDAWRSLTDWVRLEPIYARRARHVYDPGYGFRNKIYKARERDEVAWD